MPFKFIKALWPWALQTNCDERLIFFYLLEIYLPIYTSIYVPTYRQIDIPIDRCR